MTEIFVKSTSVRPKPTSFVAMLGFSLGSLILGGVGIVGAWLAIGI